MFIIYSSKQLFKKHAIIVIYVQTSFTPVTSGGVHKAEAS